MNKPVARLDNRWTWCDIRASLAEMGGTFCLVFAGCGAIMVDQLSGGQVTHVGMGLTFGLIVAAMIMATGHLSGAHLNPAVTLAFMVFRRLPPRLLWGYWVAQMAGALTAVLLLRMLFGNAVGLGATYPTGCDSQACILEVVLTAILMFVIASVSDGYHPERLAPLAIGATVALEASFAGPISGASMNPARSLAPALVTGRLNCQWIYVLGPLTGALIGAGFYQLSSRLGKLVDEPKNMEVKNAEN